MRVLGKKWQDGYLDYYRHPGEVRLNVRVWAVLSFSGDQYFVRSKDWRIVWGYLRKIGLRPLLKKISSRLSEKERNNKYLSVGIGVINQASAPPPVSGQQVAFIAYNHPLCVDRLVLDERFITPWPYSLSDEAEAISFFDASQISIPDELLAYMGWSPFSGTEVDKNTLAAGLQHAVNILKRILDNAAQPTLKLTSQRSRETQDRTAGVRFQPGSQQRALRGVLFGLGNYAKTVVLPYIDRNIQIDKIHEIDPLQLGLTKKWHTQLDTSSMPRLDDQHDVYFIAGYHHTHTPIALHALNRSAYAVIEKPIATTSSQLDELKQVLETQPSRLFACFHKRYSFLNDLALKDLNIRRGESLTYHCIVYEVPLPLRHWYRWPTSNSRVVSNGCHWIDHFLYLNDYAQVTSQAVYKAQQGDIIVLIELVNGSVFSMVLTDIGSERLGVRDYIELKAKGVTVRIIDGSYYKAENAFRVLRRKRVNPMGSYQRMYRTISRNILKGEPGDSLDSLRSSELAIALDERIRANDGSRQ
jgi:predicted dehydrogenase